jgi:hypothetical protein
MERMEEWKMYHTPRFGPHKILCKRMQSRIPSFLHTSAIAGLRSSISTKNHEDAPVTRKLLAINLGKGFCAMFLGTNNVFVGCLCEVP